MDQKATLVFLHDLSEAALTAARSGDVMLANRLGANIALQHYFNNVHTIPTMRPEVWASNFPQYMAEADRIRVAHDASEQQEARMSAIEAQLAKIAEAVAAMTEAQPVKPKRGKKMVEAEPEAESEVDDEPVADDEATAEIPSEDEPDADDEDDDEAAEDETEAE